MKNQIAAGLAVVLICGLLFCYWLASMMGSHLDDVRVTNHSSASIKIDSEDIMLGPIAPGQTLDCGKIFRSGVIRFRVLTGPGFKDVLEDWTLESGDLGQLEDGYRLNLTVPLAKGPGHKTILIGGRAVAKP